MDESLSVVAEIPMHAGLLGNNSKLKGIDSESLQIPIEGTLQHPKIRSAHDRKTDRRAVEKHHPQLCSIRWNRDSKSWSPIEPKQ